MILQRSEVCPSCSVERVLLVARRRGVNTGEEKEKRAWGWGRRGLEGRLWHAALLQPCTLRAGGGKKKPETERKQPREENALRAKAGSSSPLP
jgi:hypothetical protein